MPVSVIVQTRKEDADKTKEIIGSFGGSGGP